MAAAILDKFDADLQIESDRFFNSDKEGVDDESAGRPAHSCAALRRGGRHVAVPEENGPGADGFLIPLLPEQPLVEALTFFDLSVENFPA